MSAVTDKDEAVRIVLSIFPAADEEAVELMLEASAGYVCGTDPRTPAYRPWMVAGMMLKTRWQEYKRTKAASGAEVEYSDSASAFRQLSDVQNRLDAGICGIPGEWASIGPRAVIVF